ncbi:MAG: hypothetical protein IKP75_04740 [Oscillospiraceae bacterium]|nr:hypothetical protein [Oscillospiraceae bacterium]
MIVYLLYEHIVREYESCVMLKDRLEGMGHEAYIFNIIFERNTYIIKGKKNPPDVIFMPYFSCEANEMSIFPLIKKNPFVRVVCFHHEQLTTPGSEDYFLPKTQYTKYGAYHLAWGQYFKDQLVNSGVPKERVFITGNIRTELIKKSGTTRRELSRTYHLDEKKKWILYAESLGYYSQRITNSEIKELLSRDVSMDDIEYGRKADIEGFNAIVKDLNTLPNGFFKDFELVFRPHPGTHAPKGIPNKVKVISDRSISDWISCSDFFVSRGSTSVFEADAGEIPCVMYENPPTPREKIIPGLDKYPAINSISEITPAFIDEIRNDARHIYQDYIGVADGHVIDRIISVLSIIDNKKADRRNAKLSHKIKRPGILYTLHMFIYDIAVWVLVKTNLLEILKIPNSAYIMIKDIPYWKNNSRIIKQKKQTSVLEK